MSEIKTDVTVILPIHKMDDNVGLYLEKAIKSIDLTNNEKLKEVRATIVDTYKKLAPAEWQDVNDDNFLTTFEEGDEEAYGKFIEKIVGLIKKIDPAYTTAARGAQSDLSKALKVLIGKPHSQLTGGPILKAYNERRAAAPAKGGAKTSSNSQFRTTRKVRSR